VVDDVDVDVVVVGVADAVDIVVAAAPSNLAESDSTEENSSLVVRFDLYNPCGIEDADCDCGCDCDCDCAAMEGCRYNFGTISSLLL